MYEWTIVCNMCACLKTQGGFSSLPSLTNDQVYADAQHNPGCPVPNNPTAYPISSTQNGTYDMEYWIGPSQSNVP